ncbi:MAG: hypothetical protein ACTS22_03330 [Phycisphaerales bacterium]
MRLPPAAAAPALLVVLMTVIALLTRGVDRGSWAVGLGAGVTAALVNLLLLGSKLTEAGEEQSATLIPSAPVIVAGFFASCAVMGGVAGAVGGLLPTPTRRRPDWLARFGWTTVAALFPLIAIGGAVTSAGAGMAVPDWPGTYGSNMFLYPIGLMADPYIFLEHTHRLFGTLVGLTVLTLAIAVLCRFGGWGFVMLTLPVALAGVGITLAHNAGTWNLANQTLIGMLTPLVLIAVGALAWAVWRLSPGGLAASLFAMVCLQGMLGALRVTEINTSFGAVHGVLAQLILAGTAVLATLLMPSWRVPGADPTATEIAGRRTRSLAWFAFGSLVIQLTLAALFRHTGSSHALWTHVGFSIVAVVAVGALGFVLQSAERYSDRGRAMRRIGTALVVCIAAQFVLGFVAWALLGDGGAGPSRVVMYDELGTAAAPSLGRTLVATAHQANGAVLMALTAAGWAWGSRSVRRHGV